MKDIVTNAIDRTCTVTGDCKNTDYSKMQNCINDLRLYNDTMADKSYYQRVEELQELRKENQQLKEQLERSEKARLKCLNKIKTLGKFDGENFTRSFTLWSADFNELVKMLDIDKGE